MENNSSILSVSLCFWLCNSYMNHNHLMSHEALKFSFSIQHHSFQQYNQHIISNIVTLEKMGFHKLTDQDHRFEAQKGAIVLSLINVMISINSQSRDTKFYKFISLLEL